MGSSKGKTDFFSRLPNCILITIISMLPFKESVRTSVLSKRWRNLCYEPKNLVFKESEFVTSETLKIKKFERALFVRIMHQWISRFTGKVIENIEIHLSEPMGFELDVMSLVTRKIGRLMQVKSLSLDFTDPVAREVGRLERMAICRRYARNGFDMSHVIFNLLYVKTVTVCSFILQMIQHCDNPMELHDPLKTQHLVMKTNMHEGDFMGIRIFLNSCPELESLTFDMVTTRREVICPSPLVDPETYWVVDITYDCLKKTLRVVVVKNFRGCSNELHVLQYLIRMGLVMERLDLYEAKGLNHDQKMLVLVGAEKVQKNFKRASKDLKITLYNA